MKRWTFDEVLALGVKTDLVTACSVAYGIGHETAWKRYRAGTLDFPTLQVGRRVVVPVAPLLALLHIDGTNNAPAGPTSPTDATTTSPRDEANSNDATRLPRLRAV